MLLWIIIYQSNADGVENNRKTTKGLRLHADGIFLLEILKSA